MKKLSENFDTLKAVVYDIAQVGEADPLFIENLKNEYDSILGRRLIQKAIASLGIPVPYADVAEVLMSHEIMII